MMESAAKYRGWSVSTPPNLNDVLVKHRATIAGREDEAPRQWCTLKNTQFLAGVRILEA